MIASLLSDVFLKILKWLFNGLIKWVWEVANNWLIWILDQIAANMSDVIPDQGAYMIADVKSYLLIAEDWFPVQLCIALLTVWITIKMAISCVHIIKELLPGF